MTDRQQRAGERACVRARARVGNVNSLAKFHKFHLKTKFINEKSVRQHRLDRTVAKDDITHDCMRRSWFQGPSLEEHYCRSTATAFTRDSFRIVHVSRNDSAC